MYSCSRNVDLGKIPRNLSYRRASDRCSLVKKAFNNGIGSQKMSIQHIFMHVNGPIVPRFSVLREVNKGLRGHSSLSEDFMYIKPMTMIRRLVVSTAKSHSVAQYLAS